MLPDNMFRSSWQKTTVQLTTLESGLSTLDERLHALSGILACGCTRYPVLEGVPVLMKRPVGIISHWNDGDISDGPTA